ncbi:MAG: Ig-like domain-containing protein [Acidobacteriota bacterium]
MRFVKTSKKTSWTLLLAFLLLMSIPAGLAYAETVPVTGVSINPSYLSLTAAGYQSQLTAVITPSNATNKAVTWYTDKPSVATVDQNGVVTPQGGGTANIMVYTQDGGYEAYCRVDVVGSTNPVRVTGVTLNKHSTTLAAGGGTETLIATVSPSNAYNKEVQWFSSNDYIAYVDQNGVVWPNSYGTATITVLTVDGDHTDTCTVNVTSTTSVPVTGLSLSPHSITMAAGSTASVTATLTPANATNKIINWSSSNSSVATAYDGVIGAKAAGTTVITAKSVDGGFTDTCTVTVTAANVPVTGVTISQTGLTLNAGATATLTATLAPSNATNKNVTWSTDNSAAATVNNGVVTGVAPGSAIITVTTTDGGYTAECYVNVTATNIPVTGVSLNQTALSLNTGATATLTATVAPSNATNKSVTWSTSNSGVATVNNGVVTAVAAGTATISVKTSDGGKTANCSVTVAAPSVPVTGVILNQTALSLNTGATATLTATVAPSNATNKSVNWSTSNSGVASVNNGVVTAVAAGTATISVKTSDGGYTANCVVTVSAPVVKVTGISLNKTFVTVKKGNKITLVATVKPTNATNQGVTWSSSNTSVATVSSTGVVTALKSGFVTIKVKTIDGGYTASCTVWVTLI